jgi:hypothetical protein
VGFLIFLGRKLGILKYLDKNMRNMDGEIMVRDVGALKVLNQL